MVSPTPAAVALQGAWLALVGCAAGAEPAVAPPVAAPDPAPTAPDDASFAGGPIRVEVRSQRVLLVLPDGSGWRGRSVGTWSVLEHDATGSKLYVRQWQAARLVRPDECLAEARLSQPALLNVSDEEVVERRKLTAPPGFVGELVVAVRNDGTALHGYAELASAGIGRCQVVAFHTIAYGIDRDRELGERLALIVQHTLEKARTLTIEDRVTR